MTLWKHKCQSLETVYKSANISYRRWIKSTALSSDSSRGPNGFAEYVAQREAELVEGAAEVETPSASPKLVIERAHCI